MPVRVVWARFSLLASHRAIDVVDTARGINLAFAGEAGRGEWDRINRDAFPQE